MRAGVKQVAASALLLLIAVSPSAATYNNVKATFKVDQALFRPMFVLIGDSITEYGFQAPHGWALQLSAKYARRADIINRGFGGGLHRIRYCLLCCWNMCTRWQQAPAPQNTCLHSLGTGRPVDRLCCGIYSTAVAQKDIYGLRDTDQQ